MIRNDFLLQSPSSTFADFLDFCPAGAQNEHEHHDHSVCQIAEHYDRDPGQEDFQIERFVHKKRNNRDEWMINVRFSETDPLLDDKGPGAIIVVDAITQQPRLVPDSDAGELSIEA